MIGFLDHLCFLECHFFSFSFHSKFLFEWKNGIVGLSAQSYFLSQTQHVTLFSLYILLKIHVLCNHQNCMFMGHCKGHMKTGCKEQQTYYGNLFTCSMIHWISLPNHMFKDKIVQNSKEQVQHYIKHRLCAATQVMSMKLPWKEEIRRES